MKRGPDAHWAVCPSYGMTGGECRGCVPVDAVEGSVVCGRCFGRTRGLLQGIPDMLGHLRSLTDPLKGTDYARKAAASVGGGGVLLHAPPPVPVELLDAADCLVTVLWRFGMALECRVLEAPVLVRAGTDPGVLVAEADAMVAWVLPKLAELSGAPEFVGLVDAVIGRPQSVDEWTVRTVFERWSVAESPWWAAQPCPKCDLRAVKVTPPRMPGDETEYRCQSPRCDWVAPDDIDGFWAEAFSRREGKAA